MMPTVHAGCIVLGPVGVLITGQSGSGKSALADILVERAKAHGNFAAFVSDDRTVLSVQDGGIIAGPAETLRGLVEVRGFGIVSAPFESSARIRLVIELSPAGMVDRLPQDAVVPREISGVSVPHVVVPVGDPQNAIRVIRWAFRRLFPNGPDYV